MWTRQYGLTGQELKTLKMLVTSYVQVYFAMFLEIKVKCSLVDAPDRILKQLGLLKSQPKAVRDIVTLHVRTSA